MDIKEVSKALNTEFKPNDPEYFRLGVWHDGTTLDNSSIKISKDLDSGKTFIDILDKKGTGKGKISDITNLKQKFNKLRGFLPPGDYELNADHPTKAKMYIRDFLNQPGFSKSGEQGGARVFDKRLGKKVFKKFDTLTMNVPNNNSLENQLEALRKAKGLEVTKENQKALSALRNEVDIPEGFNIEKLNDFFRRRQTNPDAKVKVVPSKKGSSTDAARSVYEDVPGATTRNPDANPATFLRREGRTKQFYDAISELAYDDTQIEKYMYEVGRENNNLRRLVQRMNKSLPEGQKVSIGHLQPVSKTINSPFNRFLELLDPNKAKGNRYQLNPAGQMAIGNPVKPGASWLENWKRDFLVWADRPENGGDGILPQRGDYSSLMEQKFSELSGINFDKLSPEDQLKAVNDIEDLLGDIEGRNQWTISQAKQKKIWGILSESDAKQATEFFNDNELAAEIRAARLEPEITEVGSHLGGISNKLKIGAKNLMKNPFIKTAASLGTGTAKFAGKASAAFDPLNAATGTYGALTANNPATGLEQGLRGLEGGASTAAWFSPAAANVALPLAGATAIAESQRIPEVLRGRTNQLSTTITGNTSIPIGMTNMFNDLFKDDPGDD